MKCGGKLFLFLGILQIQHVAGTKTETGWTSTDEGMSGWMLEMNQEKEPGEHSGTADQDKELPWWFHETGEC